MDEKNNIRLIMNGDKAKSILGWLLKGMIFEIRNIKIFNKKYSIAFWKTWPFITVIKKEK